MDGDAPMNFTDATLAAKRGKLILRDVWCNPLRWLHERKLLEFMDAVDTGNKFPDRSYEATGIDRCATDWSVVT